MKQRPAVLALALVACSPSLLGQDLPRLVINEIAAVGDYEDWIEVLNLGPGASPETPLLISDRVERTLGKEVPVCLPPLPAGGKMVFIIPNTFNAQGEEAALHDLGGKLLDSVSFGRQLDDLSYGRLPDGSGTWVFQIPTPGHENSLDPPPQETTPGWRLRPRPLLAIEGVYREPIRPRLGEPVQVTAAVISARPLAQVFLRTAVLAPLSPAGGPPGPFQVVPAFDDGRHGDGLPGDGLWGGDIPPLTSPGWLDYQFVAIEIGGQGTQSGVFEIGIGIPTPPLRINEVMPQNTRTARFDCRDGDIRFTDWIEVCNTGDSTVDLGTFLLSDDRMFPRGERIPRRVLLPGQKWVLPADRTCLDSTRFSLSQNGEDVLLFFRHSTSRLALADAVTYPPLEAEVSYGRAPDCVGDFAPLRNPTPEGPHFPPPAAELLGIRPLVPRPEDAVELRVRVSPAIDAESARLGFRRAALQDWRFLDLAREPGSGLYLTEIPPPNPAGRYELSVRVKARDGTEHTVPEIGGGYPLLVMGDPANPGLRINEVYVGSGFCPASEAFSGLRDVVWTNLNRGDEFGGPPQAFHFVEVLVSSEVRAATPLVSITTDPFLRPERSRSLTVCPFMSPCFLLGRGELVVMEAMGEEAIVELDPAGGAVYLYETGTANVFDAAQYPPANAAQTSFGRSPDGWGAFAGLPRPTPGAPNAPDPARPFKRGDANADGKVDVSDAVFTLFFLFLGAEAPPCRGTLDVDDDGTLNVTDGIHILGFLFLGGPRPQPPHPDCGPDETPDLLSCGAYPPCG